MKDLKGLYSALLIPFDENGEVKEEGLRQVIESKSYRSSWIIRLKRSGRTC